MKKQTLGEKIAVLRKEKGMTQLELAEMMGVTDKAVSKWERDLSCPDVNTLPKLAEIFGISMDELMQIKANSKAEDKKDPGNLVSLICKAVALAMGAAVVVLSVLKELDMYSGFGMLGIGLTCVALCLFQDKDK